MYLFCVDELLFELNKLYYISVELICSPTHSPTTLPYKIKKENGRDRAKIIFDTLVMITKKLKSKIKYDPRTSSKSKSNVTLATCSKRL